MTITELRELARHAAHRTAPTEFSVANVDAALADEFKKMTGSINNFMRNKYDIFDIIIENADDIVPAKVMDAMGQFAEVITIANGDQKVFKRGGLGRNRAKKFLTQVGLSRNNSYIHSPFFTQDCQDQIPSVPTCLRYKSHNALYRLPR